MRLIICNLLQRLRRDDAWPARVQLVNQQSESGNFDESLAELNFEF